MHHCPILVVCNFAIFAAAAAAQITVTRGPAICRATSTGATIQWTTSAATAGVVAYGSTPALGNLTAPTAVASLHEVALTGLAPASRCYYRVRNGSTSLTGVLDFRTLPPAAHPFVRIAVFGDTGVNSPEQAAVAQLCGQLAPDLVLIPGDINYSTGAASTLDQNYFQRYAALLPHLPFFLAPGNHDYGTACAQPYLDNFCLPSSSSGGERWHSFDAGAVHIASVDSETLVGTNACGSAAQIAAQLAWLDADLAASTARWNIVFLHRPARSYSMHGDNTTIQAMVEPVVERRHADLLISGHDHCYQRLPRLVAGVPAASGPRHLVVGTGGAPLYAITPGPLLEYGISSHGIALLEVSGNQLRIRFIGADTGNRGQTLDDVTMSKGPTTPTVAVAARTVAPGRSTTVSMRGEQGQPWLLFIAAGTGYQPLPPHGVVLLAGVVLGIGTGSLGSGPAPVTVAVPPNPALVGLRIVFQGAAGSSDPLVGGLWIANAVEMTVQ